MPKPKINTNMLKLKKTNYRRRKEGAKLHSLEELLIQTHKRVEEEARKRRNCRYWSQLPPDLIHSVLERLNFGDLQRAKSVCSGWLSASRNCFPKSQIPWLIIFPKNDNPKLFNPEEKDKLYHTSHDLGVGVCVAAYGCWLLMRNPLFNFYIVNLLTGQRITLPPVESQLRSEYYTAESTGFEIISPRLWIDEEARDYLVIFSFRIFKCSIYTQYAVICKKGDHLWRQFLDCSLYSDMVYNHPKLYVYRYGTIQILDLSGELPLKAPESDVYAASFSFNHSHLGGPLIVKKTKIVVTVSGHVLMAVSLMSSGKNWSFRIYKMSSWTKQWQRLDSLGREAMLLNLGVTVPAKDIDGIKENSIYFSGLGEEYEDDIFIFDLDTDKIERPHQSVCSSLQYTGARWFLPGFSHKYICGSST